MNRPGTDALFKSEFAKDVADVFAEVRGAFRRLRELNAAIMSDGEPEAAARATNERRRILAALPWTAGRLAAVMPPWVAGMERGV